MKKFFYIVQRNGLVTECFWSETAYRGALEAWEQKKVLLVLPAGHDTPIGIDGSDVVNVLTGEFYRKAYLANCKSKRYLLAGVWYDSRSNLPVAYENWKQGEIDEAKRVSLPSAPEEISPEQRARNLERIRQIKSMLKQKTR